jgi:hypothetical protein
MPALHLLSTRQSIAGNVPSTSLRYLSLYVLFPPSYDISVTRVSERPFPYGISRDTVTNVYEPIKSEQKQTPDESLRQQSAYVNL